MTHPADLDPLRFATITTQGFGPIRSLFAVKEAQASIAIDRHDDGQTMPWPARDEDEVQASSHEAEIARRYPLPDGLALSFNTITGDVVLWFNDCPIAISAERVGSLIAALAEARDLVIGDGCQTTIVRMKPGYGVMPVQLETSSMGFSVSAGAGQPIIKE